MADSAAKLSTPRFVLTTVDVVVGNEGVLAWLEPHRWTQGAVVDGVRSFAYVLQDVVRISSHYLALVFLSVADAGVTENAGLAASVFKASGVHLGAR